ncbi:MAG: hypothetical protein HYR84_17040 [Planctomycetes bacterium]|nr:hypothetical protein [Planctomycetota bacterium]
MIHMPRRSVTRFFIPLIDVLILLFCIFLLMEFNSESEVDKQTEVVAEQSEEIGRTKAELDARTQKLHELQEMHAKLKDVARLEAELDRVKKELQQFEQDRPRLEKLAQLEKEIDRLRSANKKSLQARVLVRVIDIHGKDGSISYADDECRDVPILEITDAKIAKALIDRHAKEAGGKEVYYYFKYPRDGKEFPTTDAQERRYAEWFKTVAHSLEKVGP